MNTYLYKNHLIVLKFLNDSKNMLHNYKVIQSCLWEKTLFPDRFDQVKLFFCKNCKTNSKVSYCLNCGNVYCYDHYMKHFCLIDHKSENFGILIRNRQLFYINNSKRHFLFHPLIDKLFIQLANNENERLDYINNIKLDESYLPYPNKFYRVLPNFNKLSSIRTLLYSLFYIPYITNSVLNIYISEKEKGNILYLLKEMFSNMYNDNTDIYADILLQIVFKINICPLSPLFFYETLFKSIVECDGASMKNDICFHLQWMQDDETRQRYFFSIKISKRDILESNFLGAIDKSLNDIAQGDFCIINEPKVFLINIESNGIDKDIMFPETIDLSSYSQEHLNLCFSLQTILLKEFHEDQIEQELYYCKFKTFNRWFIFYEDNIRETEINYEDNPVMLMYIKK